MRNPEGAACARRRQVEVLVPHRAIGITDSWIRVVLYLLGMFSVTIVRAQIVQPPEPVDPSPINGEMYYLLNQLSGLQIDLNNNSTTPGDKILVNGRSLANLSQRWAFTKAVTGRSAIFSTAYV
jgi:hypothetical protein